MLGLLSYKKGSFPLAPFSPPPLLSKLSNPCYKPLFSGHCEQAILAKTDLLEMMGLAKGEDHLPHSVPSYHIAF